MKKNLLLSILLLQFLFASSQKYEWFTRALINGSGGGNYEAPVSVDPLGNVYTIINTDQSGTLIQGDTINCINTSSSGIIIAKFNNSGNLLWAKMFNGNGSVHAGERIAVDNAGAVYAGVFIQNGTTISTDTTYANTDQYQLIKLDSSGHFIRTKFYSGGSIPRMAILKTDIYVAQVNYIEKLDSALNTTWHIADQNAALNFSNSGSDRTDIFVQDNGQLVASAYESFNSSGADPFAGDTVHFSAGNFDEVAIVKMDTSGHLLWSRTITGSQPNVRAVALDHSGNVYIAISLLSFPVYFANDTIFNTLNAVARSMALLKWDSAGTPLWSKGIYPALDGGALTDLAVNAQNDILLSGTTPSTLTTAIGKDTIFPFASSGFVIKLNSNGSFKWYKSVNNTSSAGYFAGDLAVRNGNEYIAAGVFYNGGLTINMGCFSYTASPRFNFITYISEQPEPVPQVGFTLLQSENTILVKDTTPNATSISWDLGDAASSSLSQPIHQYISPGVYNVCLTATNGCGQAQQCTAVQVKGIRTIISNQGSNKGVATADIYGGGFTPATTVLLKKTLNADIVPVKTTYINAGKLEVILDLTGKTIGLWNVEVTVPGNTVMTLTNAYTITNDSIYKIEVTNNGTLGSRPNRWFASQFTVHNNSNQDAVGVPVIYRIHQAILPFVNYSFLNPTQINFLNSGLQYLNAHGLNVNDDNYNFNDTTSSSKFGAFIIPLIKANSSFTFPLYLYGTQDNQSSKIIFALAPLLESSALAGNNQPAPDFCFGEYLQRGIENTFSITISPSQWGNCFPALYDSLLSMTSVQANDFNNSSLGFSFPSVIVSMMAGIASSGCVSGIPASLSDAQMNSVINKTFTNMIFIDDIDSIMPYCSLLGEYRLKSPQPVNKVESIRTKCEILVGNHPSYIRLNILISTGIGAAIVPYCVIISHAFDPNQLSGPGNNSDDIYQKPGDISAYTIEFENDSSATARANTVVITDTLDKSRFDFSTFRFHSITLSDSLKFDFDDPGYSQIKLSKLSAGNSDYLRTEAVFDTSIGVVRWTMTTVDPVNFQPDTKGLDGFLPPNINGTEGTGYVSYQINLKSSLVTGDSIKNKASIVFDNNSSIATNNWLNVIDILKPQSAVNSLPATTATDSFLVSWSGTDVISGINSFNVYVSVNDQPYQPWIISTDTTQAMYHGVIGNKYKFYSRSTDNAGNVEDAPADPDHFPDAVTRLVLGVPDIAGISNLSVYPNPVNQSAIISFNLLNDAHIRISLIDVVGKEVLMLKNDLLPPGSYSQQFNLSSISHGIYTVNIVANENRTVKQLIKIE